MTDQQGARQTVEADAEIRCCDCDWYDEAHIKCCRPALVLTKDGTVLDSEEEGWMVLTDAHPNGFCAWGKRKEDE